MLVSEALVLVARLEAIRPQARIPDETRRAYAEYLQPYPVELGRRAVDRLAKYEEGWHFPTVATIIRYIEAERKRLPAHHELAAPELESGEVLIPPPAEAVEAIRELAEAAKTRGGEFDE